MDPRDAAFDSEAARPAPETDVATRRPTWQRTSPPRPGYYRLWDPDRGVNALVEVFCARGGRLAVRNPCACCPAFFVDMWRQSTFANARWLGPLDVPSTLPASWSAPRREEVDGVASTVDRRVRRGRCLLGPHA